METGVNYDYKMNFFKHKNIAIDPDADYNNNSVSVLNANVLSKKTTCITESLKTVKKWEQEFIGEGIYSFFLF